VAYFVATLAESKVGFGKTSYKFNHFKLAQSFKTLNRDVHMTVVKLLSLKNILQLTFGGARGFQNLPTKSGKFRNVFENLRLISSRRKMLRVRISTLAYILVEQHFFLSQICRT